VNDIEKLKRDKKLFYLCFHNDPTLSDFTTKRLVDVVRPLLEKLFNEIRRSFDYFREHFERTHVDKIILSGKGSLAEGMDENFKKIFSIPVEYLNVSTLFVAKSSVNVEQLNNNILDFAILLGLAIGKQKQINFVPDIYKQRKTKLSQIVVTSVLSGAAFMISCVLIVFLFFRIGGLKQEIDKSNVQMGDIVPQVQAFNAQCMSYRQNRTYLENLRMRQLLLANSLKELSNIAPRAITFQKLYLVEDGWLNINGFVFDDTLAELSSESVLTDFIIALENSPFFTEVKLVSSERGDEYEVAHSVFVLSCKIVSRKDIRDI